MSTPESIMTSHDVDLGFSFRLAKTGDVHILRHARVVTVLRAGVAREFLADIEAARFEEQQQLMARVTGNYKRGNERHANAHPRNSEPHKD